MENRPAELAGKVALVTGGARRIGAAIVETLHEAGMDIALHYRRSGAAAEALAGTLAARRPGSAQVFQADLLDTAALAPLVERVVGDRGRLDALINNASSFFPTPVGSVNEGQWEDLLGTNLKAPFFLAQAAAPHLAARRGCIVNITDIYARRPLRQHPVYSAAKAGLEVLTRALARELGPEVRVNAVAPGAILWPEAPLAEETQRRLVARTALKRQGEPGDVARAVLFLVREAGYTTGHTVVVDGGRELGF